MNLLKEDITGKIDRQNFLCSITWRNGVLIMDEPVETGGQDLGPDPYSTLLAALAGCTLSTLRMYINRKGWEIPEINISLNMSQELGDIITTTFNRVITFSDGITDEQKEKLLLIAKKCPVSKILEHKIIIQTTI